MYIYIVRNENAIRKEHIDGSFEVATIDQKISESRKGMDLWKDALKTTWCRSHWVCRKIKEVEATPMTWWSNIERGLNKAQLPEPTTQEWTKSVIFGFLCQVVQTSEDTRPHVTGPGKGKKNPLSLNYAQTRTHHIFI